MRADEAMSAVAADGAADRPAGAAGSPSGVAGAPPGAADPPVVVALPAGGWLPARSPARSALIAAGAALMIWLGFAIFLLTQSGAGEVTWGRIAWVFGSVESVAFAAAGVLFGSTVSRGQVETAQQQAQTNQADAESGRALAALLKADEPGGDVAARHRRLAHHLFPETRRAGAAPR